MASGPYGLAVASKDASSIGVEWGQYQDFDEIRCYIRADADPNFSLDDTIAGSATSHTFDGLAGATLYHFYVAGVLSGVEYDSNIVSDYTTLAAPSGLAATAHATDPEIQLDWTNNGSYDAIEIMRRRIDESDFSLYRNISGALETYTVGQLEEGCQYFFKIRSIVDWSIYSDYTAEAEDTTALPAPTGLAATVMGANRIDLSWTNASYEYDGLEIYISTNGSDWTLGGAVEGNASFYSVTGLANGTLYYFKVRASRYWRLGGSGWTFYSDYTADTTATTGYPAPSNLRGTASPTQVALAWDDNTTDEDGFEVWRGDSPLDTVGPNVTDYIATGLSASTWYRFRVRAYKGSVYSPLSNEITIFTSDPPPAPSGLVVVPVSTTSLQLRWADNSDNETGFEIEESADGVAGWANVTTTGPNVTSYTRTGLASDTLRYYRVRATNASGDSAYCAIAYARTLADIAAPANLTLRAYSGTEIELRFDDNSAAEDGHSVERKTGAGGAWAEIVELEPNRTYYRDTGLSSANTYFYRVRARQGAAYSGYCDEASETPIPAPTAPGAPTASETQDTQTRLTWTWTGAAGEPDPAGYIVKKSTDGGVTYPTEYKLYTAVKNFLAMGLVASTEYYFVASAFSAAGESADSAPVAVTTAAQYTETALEKALRRDERPIVQVEINAKTRVVGFTLRAACTYTYELEIEDKRIAIDTLLENGTALVEVDSIADVETTAGSWHWDNEARMLYAHPSGSDAPANYYLEASFWLYFQDRADAGASNVWSDRQYFPYLSQGGLGPISSSIAPNRAGSFQIANGSVTIGNPLMGDGSHFWDRLYARWTWRGMKIRFCLGCPSFSHSEFEPIHQGIIDAVSISDVAITFRFVDPREGMHRDLPFNHYWPDEYPALPEDNKGRSKPFAFGTITGAPLISIDATNRRYAYHDNAYRTGGVSAVYLNGTALVADTDYFDDSWRNVVTLAAGLEFDDEDALTCDYSGIVQADNTAITNGIAALRFKLLNWLGQTESDLNRDKFFEAEFACTETCSIPLYSEKSSRTIIRTIEQTLDVVTFPDLQGRLAVSALAASAPSSVRYVRDHMISDYRQSKSRETLYHRVRVKYAQDPKNTQLYSEVEKVSTDARYKHGVLKTYEVETYLTSEANAVARAAEIEAALDRDTIEFRGPRYLLTVLPGDVIYLSRSRYFSAAGLASEVEALALGARRDLASPLGVSLKVEAL